MAEAEKLLKSMRNALDLRPGAQEAFDRLVEQFRPFLGEDRETTATVVLAWLETLMRTAAPDCRPGCRDEGHRLDVSTLYDSMLPTMFAASTFDDCVRYVGVDPLHAREALNRFRDSLKHPRSRLPRAAIRFLARYGIYQLGSRMDRRSRRSWRIKAVAWQDAFLADRFGDGYLAHARAGAKTYVMRMVGKELIVDIETRTAAKGGRKTSRLAVLAKGCLTLLGGHEQKLEAFKKLLDAGLTCNALVYPASLMR